MSQNTQGNYYCPKEKPGIWLKGAYYCPKVKPPRWISPQDKEIARGK